MTQHKNIFVALAAAQGEMSAPVKGAVNPAFKSKYADLWAVVTAVTPALSKHGISFFHYTAADQMVTALVHGESDTRIECSVPLIVGKHDMQGYKSATTYAKRIGLESVTGVAPEDDDGNAASKNPPPKPQLISSDDYIRLSDLIEQAGADVSRLCTAYAIARLEDLPQAKVAEVADTLGRKIAKRLADAKVATNDD